MERPLPMDLSKVIFDGSGGHGKQGANNLASEAFRAKHGDKRITLLQEQHIEALIGEKAGKPAAQRNLLRVLRSLLKVAVKAKMRRENPALGIELERLESTGCH